jgi:PHP family Zn ribbon phosphoesterase
MKITYDLHIHTALSPCSFEDMTPNNIVNMALLNEVDVIAITDHNSCENIESVLKVASTTDLIVIPGIEVETREEVHMICLFSSLELAYNVQAVVYNHLPQRRNNKRIFGEQLLFNEEDDPIGVVDRLLSFACDLSLEEVVSLCKDNDGVCVPAHIDRPSYSIISNLGMLPEHLFFPTLEVSRHSDLNSYIIKYPGHRLIQNSDAHDLGFIGSCKQSLDVSDRTIESVLKSLKEHQ